mmetsp:Transcript_46653/g.34218  ORF Transcript_46653/g.34218 Transcript_46653/m.34218 type:complete len:82 (-) Transcript_46653:574-819(-)
MQGKGVMVSNLKQVKSDISLKQIRLYLLGANEVVGLEEVIDPQNKKRKVTVMCSSNGSVAYFIKKDDFINCINQFKFNDRI